MQCELVSLYTHSLSHVAPSHVMKANRTTATSKGLNACVNERVQFFFFYVKKIECRLECHPYPFKIQSTTPESLQ